MHIGFSSYPVNSQNLDIIQKSVKKTSNQTLTIFWEYHNKKTIYFYLTDSASNNDISF